MFNFITKISVFHFYLSKSLLKERLILTFSKIDSLSGIVTVFKMFTFITKISIFHLYLSKSLLKERLILTFSKTDNLSCTLTVFKMFTFKQKYQFSTFTSLNLS